MKKYRVYVYLRSTKSPRKVRVKEFFVSVRKNQNPYTASGDEAAGMASDEWGFLNWVIPAYEKEKRLLL